MHNFNLGNRPRAQDKFVTKTSSFRARAGMPKFVLSNKQAQVVSRLWRLWICVGPTNGNAVCAIGINNFYHKMNLIVDYGKRGFISDCRSGGVKRVRPNIVCTV
jgi:hypothetical protein